VGRKTCRRILALGVLGCLTALANAASPVWAIHGDHNTVYLAGSVHLLKAGDSALPAAFDRAYAGSRTLVMELDLGKVDTMQAAAWMAQHGVLPEGTDLKKAIGDTRYQRVSTEASRLGLPLEMVDQFAPWVLGLQLMELQYAKSGFDSEQGVEQQLEHRAQADGKATSGLETLEEQLGYFETLTPDQQARFLDLVLNDLHEVDSDTQDVIRAWRAGDVVKLAALLSDEYRQFPALYQLLVTNRNKHWEPQLQQLLHGKDNYFVVVGALHLVGENGLLQLLRKDGFKVEQLN
jgi:uncharacterized protein